MRTQLRYVLLIGGAMIAALMGTTTARAAMLDWAKNFYDRDCGGPPMDDRGSKSVWLSIDRHDDNWMRASYSFKVWANGTLRHQKKELYFVLNNPALKTVTLYTNRVQRDPAYSVRVLCVDYCGQGTVQDDDDVYEKYPTKDFSVCETANLSAAKKALRFFEQMGAQAVINEE
jgi:hypothetical protein